MSNNYSQLNDKETKDLLSKFRVKSPKIDVPLLNKKLNNKKIYNFSNDFNNISKNINKIANLKKEKKLNNSANNEKTPEIKNYLRKIKIIKKIKLPTIQDKYSNEILFKDRITKHYKFFTRNKSNFINDKSDINKRKNSTNEIIKYNNDDITNNKKNIYNMKKFNIFNHFFSKKRNKNYFYSDNRLNRNNSSKIFNKNINISSSTSRKNENNFSKVLPRVNSAFFVTGLNVLSNENISSLLLNSNNNIDDNDKIKEKIISKITINENLQKLLYRLNKKFKPQKKTILSSSNKHKLPYISFNIKDKINKSESCIHKKEYGDFIVFEKTHLDGLKPGNEVGKIKKDKNYKNFRKYEINEGYVDLGVLNSGNNISFKTNLIEKNGLYYYEFNKYGRMETIEGKVHKIIKDKKEFKKLLEKYNQNENNKNMQNHDFEINVKRNYGVGPIINNNIYNDLFHLLFKKKKY